MPVAKPKGTKSASITRDAKSMTKKDLALVVDEVIDTVNANLSKAGQALEDAANLLFRVVMNNDSSSALDPQRRANPVYLRLRERAGHSLRLTPDDLREFIIIGALNHRLSTTGWSLLSWSMKQELVSLVTPRDKQLVALRRGIAFASKPNASLRELREWKRREFPTRPGDKGRPQGLTVASGRKLFARNTRLSMARERKVLVDRLRKLSPAEQSAFAKELDASIESLRKLREELR